MRLHCVGRQDTDLVRAGWIVAREIPASGEYAALGKGHVLSADEVGQLVQRPWSELHLIEPDTAELHERDAGQRLARASAGNGVHLGEPGGGHWPLLADHRGVLRVEVDALTALNMVDGACVYTRYDGQIVDAGTVVARAKATPLVLAARAVRRAEAIAQRAGGLVRVAPFRAARVGLVVQETLEAHSAMRFQSALERKLSWLGASMLSSIAVAAEAGAIAQAFTTLMEAGSDILLIAGTKSLDPLDPAFGALQALGVRLDRYGVPAHPGSLLWIGHWGERPVVGLPTCGLFAQITSFDVVFPRLLAGECTDAAAIASIAHGGLLTRDVSFFAAYDR